MRYDILLMVAMLLPCLPATAHDTEPSMLELGDGKISSAPAVGYVYSCSRHFGDGGGAQFAGPWIQGGYWNPAAKPVVDGQVTWPDAAITMNVEGGQRIIRANNLPLHPTGEYPIQPGTLAYQYDRNPNSITEQSILLTLPATPELADQPSCVPMGMIGFALDGTAIFNALDGMGRDAAAHEIQDRCNGHPERSGQYHYHGWSPCMPDASGDAGKHSDIVGFMLDGFPIFGPKGENGKELTSADLDSCHGHTHEIMLDGKKTVMYHYHFTRDYPYSVGCFRGKMTESQQTGERPQNSGPAGRMAPVDRGLLLDKAASLLGIEPQRLRQALGPPPPDFDAAAAQLGIPADSLRQAFQAAHRQLMQDGN